MFRTAAVPAPRAALAALAALPLAFLAACSDAPSAPLGDAAKPNAALSGGGGGGTTPTDPQCTAAGCPLDKQVVVASRKLANGKYAIFRLTPTGQVIDRLTNHDYDDFFPALSPDGTKVAFMSRRDGGGIFIMELKYKSFYRLQETSGDFAGLSWSPDGKTLVWAASPDGKMDIYRRTASLSYPTLYRVTNDAAYDKNPTFAPNSHSIIIASDRDKANTPGFDLYRLNAFGAVEKRLTQTGDYSESGAAFSANGAKMVYHRRSHGALYEDNVVLTDELMTSPQTIWAAITREMDSPTLSADGSYVMVKMNSGGSRGLFRARTWGADKQVTRITPVGEEWIMPGWTN